MQKHLLALIYCRCLWTLLGGYTCYVSHILLSFFPEAMACLRFYQRQCEGCRQNLRQPLVSCLFSIFTSDGTVLETPLPQPKWIASVETSYFFQKTWICVLYWALKSKYGTIYNACNWTISHQRQIRIFHLVELVQSFQRFTTMSFDFKRRSVEQYSICRNSFLQTQPSHSAAVWHGVFVINW